MPLKPARPFNEIELIFDNHSCDYGCGNTATYINEQLGKYQCSEFATQCPEIRRQNATKIALRHLAGEQYVLTNDDRRKAGPGNTERNRERRATNYQLGKLTISEWRTYTTQDNPELYICECGQGAMWNGKPLTLQVDHIDGNHANNDQNNLRWLCPNCHTQTPTWGTKGLEPPNKKRA